MRLPDLNDPALSKQERDHSRFPHLEPIGLHPRARVDRTLLGREGGDPAASLCPKPIDYTRPQHGPIPHHDPALFANRENRTHQVLIRPHASRDAVHNDAYVFSSHSEFLGRIAIATAPAAAIARTTPIATE